MYTQCLHVLTCISLLKFTGTDWFKLREEAKKAVAKNESNYTSRYYELLLYRSQKTFQHTLSSDASGYYLGPTNPKL